MRTRLLQRMPALLLGSGALLIASALLIWTWRSSQPQPALTPSHPPPAPAIDPVHSTVSLNAARITNDGLQTQITVTLRDAHGRPVAHAPIRVAPSRSLLTTATGWTDRLGRFSALLAVPPALRHRQAASGAVVVRVYAGAGNVVLRQMPRLSVYNRVVVLLQGLGTSLHCRDSACLPSMFTPLTDGVLRPLGYSAGGATPTILEYSYGGGQMSEDSGTWRWQPRPYDLCDTMQPVAQSAQMLRDMLVAYRARYPYTSFELIGHSLGGLVALEAAGDRAFLARLGGQSIDKVVTIDSPLNGITGFNPETWIVDLFGGFTHLLGCSSQRFGINLVGELSGLGDQSPTRQHQWAAATRAADVAVLDITNRQDVLVPEAYAVIDDGQPLSVVDRLLYNASSAQSFGHSALLYPTLGAGQANPDWSNLTAALRGYLRQPCLAFAPPDTACHYPGIDRGL